MKESLREELKSELVSRGFMEGVAPNGSITFCDEYYDACSLAEVLEQMVARREKAFRSVEVIGEAPATEIYDDAELVISAVKVVLHKLEEREQPASK